MGHKKRAPNEEEDTTGFANILCHAPAHQHLAARLGHVRAGPNKEYVRLEVDVAPKLGAVPVRPNVVFVLDASHSVGPRGLEAQLTLMRSFWSHLPDARVEVVIYRRRAARLFSAFVGLKRAEQMLAAAGAAGKLAPANGSNLDQVYKVSLSG